MSTFHERLHELRKSKHMTQKDLAEFLGVNLRTVQYYESGEKRPDLDGLRKLADFFGVSLDYLSGKDSQGVSQSPEEAEFLKWVKDKVTSSFFYDWHQSQNKDEYMECLRLIWKLEKGRKPGQKQGEAPPGE